MKCTHFCFFNRKRVFSSLLSYSSLLFWKIIPCMNRNRNQKSNWNASDLRSFIKCGIKWHSHGFMIISWSLSIQCWNHIIPYTQYARLTVCVCVFSKNIKIRRNTSETENIHQYFEVKENKLKDAKEKRSRAYTQMKLDTNFSVLYSIWVH